MALSEDIQELTAAVRDLIVVLERADRGGGGGAGGVPGVAGVTGGRSGGAGETGTGVGAAAGALGGALGLGRLAGVGAIAAGVGLADQAARFGQAGFTGAGRGLLASLPLLGELSGESREQRLQNFQRQGLQPFFDLAEAGIEPTGRALRETLSIQEKRFAGREKFEEKLAKVFEQDASGRKFEGGGLADAATDFGAAVVVKLEEVGQSIVQAINSAFGGGAPQ